jgi:hypothetical protein
MVFTPLLASKRLLIGELPKKDHAGIQRVVFY